AKPSGTRTPNGCSSRIISPSEAFLPPTRPTSDSPISENQRTKRIRVPLPSAIQSAHLDAAAQRVVHRTGATALPAPAAAGLRSQPTAARGIFSSGGDSMRRIGWLAAIPAFALACATSSSSEKMSDTTKAQSSAQSAFQKAADAQKKAVDEQQKLEQAQRDVVAAQKA